MFSVSSSGYTKIRTMKDPHTTNNLCYAPVAHKMNKSEIKHIYDNLLVAIIHKLP